MSHDLHGYPAHPLDFGTWTSCGWYHAWVFCGAASIVSEILNGSQWQITFYLLRRPGKARNNLWLVPREARIRLEPCSLNLTANEVHVVTPHGRVQQPQRPLGAPPWSSKAGAYHSVLIGAFDATITGNCLKCCAECSFIMGGGPKWSQLRLRCSFNGWGLTRYTARRGKVLDPVPCGITNRGSKITWSEGSVQRWHLKTYPHRAKVITRTETAVEGNKLTPRPSPEPAIT